MGPTFRECGENRIPRKTHIESDESFGFRFYLVFSDDNDNNIFILHDYMITIDYMISGHTIRNLLSAGEEKKACWTPFLSIRPCRKIPSS